MAKIDPMTIATRAFNTPLMLDPAKAAVIVEAIGPKLLQLGADVEIEWQGDFSAPDAARQQPRPQSASMIGDELYRHVSRRGGGYSNIQGIAVIPVIGTLVRRGSYVGASSGVTSYEGLSAQIRAAAADDEVRVIALEIDSFGGEADGMFDLAAQIREARAIKPVHAFLAEHALSAGYAIAAQADSITIPPYGYAGSIGVVSMHVDMSKKLDREGIKITLVHSGAHKVEGNPYEALPDGVRARMQKDNDAMWAGFAEIVEKGRRGRMSVADAMKTEAAIFSGQAAVDIGLVDRVAEARAAFAELLAEVNPNVAPVEPAATAMAAGPLPALPRAGARVLLGNLPEIIAEVNSYRMTPDADVMTPDADVVVEPAGSDLGSPGCIPGADAPQQEEPDMAKDVKTPDAEAQTDKAAVTPKENVAGSGDNAAEQARADERERASKITAKVRKAGLPMSLAQSLIDAGTSYADAMEQIIDAKADRAQDGGDIVNVSGAAVVTHDGRERMSEGMTRAILGKVGMTGGEQNEFSSMGLKEMARACLIGQGGRVPMGGSMALAGAAFAPATAGAAHSTSDFGNILANVSNKSMLKGFSEAVEVFEAFTSVGTMTDFKAHKRVGVDEFSALSKVEEGAEFQYGTLGDHGETAILATYGKLFAITRQAIINDDLGAFTRIPELHGRAARRTVGNLVFAVLSANAAMSDGTALFHANHGNLAATGAAPSEATINAMITGMAVQKDRSGNATLNIGPKFLLAPPKWRSAVLTALNSEYAPDDTDKVGTAKMSRAFNTVRNVAEPIFDARITGDEWYMLGDPAMFDTIEVGYLDGVSTPFLDQQVGWGVDGTEFKVRIDAVATALAWQAMQKNPGS